MTSLAADFTTYALSQVGAPNPFPPVTAPTAQPAALPTIGNLDGSDLVAWAAAMVGAAGVPADYPSLLSVIDAGRLQVPIATGKRTRGALLIRAGQIGISLGDGRVIVPAGVGYAIDNADSAPWAGAADCPGVVYR